jgi:hypothetical protein
MSKIIEHKIHGILVDYRRYTSAEWVEVELSKARSR